MLAANICCAQNPFHLPVHSKQLSQDKVDSFTDPVTSHLSQLQEANSDVQYVAETLSDKFDGLTRAIAEGRNR